MQYDTKTKFYDIMLNENCTLDCSFCCLGEKSHKIIDINKLLSVIELDNISIHIAGEPLASIKSSKTLYHLLKLLQNVQEKEVIMTTNLIYDLTDTRLSCINMVDRIKTSFNIKNRFGNIHNLLLWRRNLKTISENKTVEIIVSLDKYTLRAHNPGEYDNFFRSLGSNIIYRFVPYIPYGNGDHEDLKPTKEEFHKFIKDSIPFRNKWYDQYSMYRNDIGKINMTDDIDRLVLCNYCSNGTTVRDLDSIRNEYPYGFIYDDKILNGRIVDCIDTDCNKVSCLMDKNCKVAQLSRYKKLDYVCPHLCYLLDEGEDVLKVINSDIEEYDRMRKLFEEDVESLDRLCERGL